MEASAATHIADINRRLLEGETIPDEEIIQAIQLLRADRGQKQEAKAKKASAKAEQAQAGENLLDSL